MACLVSFGLAAQERHPALELATIFSQVVDKRVHVPQEETDRYGILLRESLAQAGVKVLFEQYVVLVDRDPLVQAVFIYFTSPERVPLLIGASPASTGRPGKFEYFETPVGVFEHTLENPDFRAEGTRNSMGIRGYGKKGMRVFDFGWQQAEKGWGDHAMSTMRLQMHATDPDFLESRLGTPQSKGCIRIPTTLNHFLDEFGVLDANYEQALQSGKKLWMLRSDRRATQWSGRYLVVVDTSRLRRPEWTVTTSQNRLQVIGRRP